MIFKLMYFHNIFSSLMACLILACLFDCILDHAMCTEWNFNESSLFEAILFQLPFFNT